MAFHVLIIDDDAAFRKILEKRLTSFIPELTVSNCEALEAARKLLREVRSDLFDLVIIDEHLPDGRGAEFIAEGWLQNLAVISMSSDDAPEIPGAVIQAGATYFVGKRSVSEALFRPLVSGIIDRNRLQRQLDAVRINNTILDTVKTLVGTLRHEINNPLGAVLGAAYVLQRNKDAAPEQKEAAELVESSGKRIKHVLDELCKAIELEPVTKASHKVFHIPGDKPWEQKN
ncbi:MAG: response regulator [Oligoflexia bacterium]|nr:response regulator [Oligoflexia bacterium]